LKNIDTERRLEKYDILTLPNPSRQGRGTHPYTPLKRGFALASGGWEKARVRGMIDFCKTFNIYVLSLFTSLQ